MALRRLEPALSSVVGPRRFLVGVSASAITPASFSGLVLWNESVAGKVFTTATGSTAAGNGDTVGRVDPMTPGLPSFTQATAGSRPALGLDAAGRLEIRGNGSGACLSVSPTLSLGDYTAYYVVTHTAAAICGPAGAATGGSVGAFQGLYSDGNSYFLPGDGTALAVACTLTGNLVLRYRRVGTATRFACTGQADAAMVVTTGASPGYTWGLDTMLCRVGFDSTAAGNGFSKSIIFNRGLSAGEMRTLEGSYLGGVL